MENCIFCKIMNGEIPSSCLFEDDVVKVIMDINPVTNGHCMVIPKKHYTNVDDIDDETLGHVMKVARNFYRIEKDALNAEGMTLVQNNGLGQEIKHYHLHLIPRYSNDNAALKANKDLLQPVEDIFKKF